jgi:hypothetical protein
MFRLEETEIAKAVNRCREVKPTVRILSFGKYSVTGSKMDGTIYTVNCFRDQESFKTVDCNCKAGSFDRACFHAMAAVSLHLYLAQVQAILLRQARRIAKQKAALHTGANY